MLKNKAGKIHFKFNEASMLVHGSESWALNLEELEH
jgi:hypothetical protein